MTIDLCTPWTLHFDRDGTEDFGIICDADGNDIAASHLPCTRIGGRTFRTGTFWLPEERDPTPVVLRQLRLMTAAPKPLDVLKALATTARTFRNVPDEAKAWTSIDDDALDQAFAAIAEAEK